MIVIVTSMEMSWCCLLCWKLLKLFFWHFSSRWFCSLKNCRTLRKWQMMNIHCVNIFNPPGSIQSKWRWRKRWEWKNPRSECRWVQWKFGSGDNETLMGPLLWDKRARRTERRCRNADEWMSEWGTPSVSGCVFPDLSVFPLFDPVLRLFYGPRVL